MAGNSCRRSYANAFPVPAARHAFVEPLPELVDPEAERAAGRFQARCQLFAIAGRIVAIVVPEQVALLLAQRVEAASLAPDQQPVVLHRRDWLDYVHRQTGLLVTDGLMDDVVERSAKKAVDVLSREDPAARHVTDAQERVVHDVVGIDRGGHASCEPGARAAGNL